MLSCRNEELKISKIKFSYVIVIFQFTYLEIKNIFDRGKIFILSPLTSFLHR